MYIHVFIWLIITSRPCCEYSESFDFRDHKLKSVFGFYSLVIQKWVAVFPPPKWVVAITIPTTRTAAPPPHPSRPPQSLPRLHRNPTIITPRQGTIIKTNNRRILISSISRIVQRRQVGSSRVGKEQISGMIRILIRGIRSGNCWDMANLVTHMLQLISLMEIVLLLRE